jgi:alpha-1,2-mannosyltransferase
VTGRPVATPVARLGRVAYVVALVAATAYGLLILLSAAEQGSLGFDWRAYDMALDRLFAGASMYDPNAQATGVFGLFFYPPPFALLLLPLRLIPPDLRLVAWICLLATATVAAIALLPVPSRVRWLVLLLAALSWPLVYAVKLGQVGPILLLLFAVGWRWMNRPWPFGIAAALGTVIKVQPALLIGWAVVTGRRRAAVIAVGLVALLAAAATAVAGPQSWLDEASLLGRVSQPVLTEHAFGVGRLAYEAGVGESMATLIHWLNLGLVVIVTAFAVWRASPVASYLAVVVASQFVSPVLWDHYALVLLLPTAWLLSRGRWWAVLIPLATSTFLVGISPPVAYPIAFWVTLLAVTFEGVRERRSAAFDAGAGSVEALFAPRLA